MFYYRMPQVAMYPHGEHMPKIGNEVFLAQGSVLIGDLQMGTLSSVWFNTVLRADVHSIRVGERTNIQDACIVHVTHNRFSTSIGDDVTIGHRAVIHGCRIGNRCLIGMGAVVMDGVEVGDDSVVGAGALLSPGKKFPPRSLIVGSPGRIVRSLEEKEVAQLLDSARHYVALAGKYRPHCVQTEASST